MGRAVVKRAGFLVAGIVALIVGLVVWGIFSNYEWKEKLVQIPATAEAKNDEFLALARTFARRGYLVQRASGFAEFWNSASSVVVTNERFLLRLSVDTVRNLDRWLQGPVVLVVLWESLDEEDLDEAAYEWMRSRKVALASPQRAQAYAQNPRLVESNSNETLMSIDWGSTAAFEPVDETWSAQGIDAEGSVRWLEFRSGASRVVWTTSGAFWSNEALAQGDHARLLERLELPGDSRSVSILRAGAAEAEPIPPEWAALALPIVLVLALWSWRGAVRTRPIFEGRDDARTSLKERYQAEGSFLWHSAARSALLEKLVGDARSYLESRFPGRSPAELWNLASQLTGIAQDEWERAFTLVDRPNAAHVRFVVDRLEKLRRIV